MHFKSYVRERKLFISNVNERIETETTFITKWNWCEYDSMGLSVYNWRPIIGQSNLAGTKCTPCRMVGVWTWNNFSLYSWPIANHSVSFIHMHYRKSLSNLLTYPNNNHLHSLPLSELEGSRRFASCSQWDIALVDASLVNAKIYCLKNYKWHTPCKVHKSVKINLVVIFKNVIIIIIFD